METFSRDMTEAKECMDKAAEAAARGDWVSAERALREVQHGARELMLISLKSRLGDG